MFGFINLVTINFPSSPSLLPFSSPLSSDPSLFSLPLLTHSTVYNSQAQVAAFIWRDSFKDFRPSEGKQWQVTPDFLLRFSLVFFLTSGAFSSGCPTFRMCRVTGCLWQGRRRLYICSRQMMPTFTHPNSRCHSLCSLKPSGIEPGSFRKEIYNQNWPRKLRVCAPHIKS